MDTVSWLSTVHLSITTFKLLQCVTAGYMNSVWINREDVKYQPSVSCLFPPAKQKHQCSLHETLTSGDTGLRPITFSWCRNSTLACTEKKHTDAKNLHIILHLWGSWWQSSHGLRMVWSQNSWWVWYEPLGKEEGWRGGGAFLISSQADRQKPAPHLSRRGNALCSQQGVLWVAHLVSMGRRGQARVKLRKWG